MIIAAFVMLTFVTPMFKVGSGSMEPTLPENSRVIIHEKEAYEIGDIITFRADDNEVVTHRLVEYGPDDTLVTQGDANPTPDVWDEPLTESDVIGKMIYMTPIMTLGFWMTPRGIGIILLLLGIVVVSLWRVEDDELEDAGKHTS